MGEIHELFVLALSLVGLPGRLLIMVRAGSRQNGFFLRISVFEPLVFFFADFLAGLFFSYLLEKTPGKSLQETLQQNPSEFIQEKSPTHFCRGARPTMEGSPMTTYRASGIIVLNFSPSHYQIGRPRCRGPSSTR